ncbi:MAG: TolC family protein [Nitrospirota bacterium]
MVRQAHHDNCHPEPVEGWIFRSSRKMTTIGTSFATNKRVYIFISFAIILFLIGCASVQTTEEWKMVNAFATERTGVSINWQQTEEDVRVTNEEVNKLLIDGLTEDDAVRIALLNNKRLQSSFEEIGVAKADLVQAGLFSNPNFSAVFRFPFEGGGTDIEADGLFKISDLWQIPLRKKVASARLEATVLKISEEILNTVAEARGSHNEYIALSRMRLETENIKRQMEELRSHLIYRQKFGLTKDIDKYMLDAEVLELEEEMSRIEKDLQVSRIRLNRMLGLSPEQFNYEVTGNLSEEFKLLPDLETMITHAFSYRPDIQISKIKVEDSKRVLELERSRIFANVEAGIAYARDPDRTDFMGPEIEIQLPIFDQNQALIAKAEYRLRQAEKELQAKMGLVREEVSSVVEQIPLARLRVELIRDKLLLIREAAMEYAEKYFNAMQLSMLYLLDARQKLFEAQRRLVEALREQRNQEIELERTLGSKIPLQK